MIDIIINSRRYSVANRTDEITIDHIVRLDEELGERLDAVRERVESSQAGTVVSPLREAAESRSRVTVENRVHETMEANAAAENLAAAISSGKISTAANAGAVIDKMRKEAERATVVADRKTMGVEAVKGIADSDGRRPESLLDAESYYELGSYAKSKPDNKPERLGKEYAGINGRILAVLGGLDEETVTRIDSRELDRFVSGYLYDGIYRIFFEPGGRRHYKRSDFLLDGEKYRFPQTGYDIESAPMPCSDTTAGAFCDASELFLQNRFRYGAMIVSILCCSASDCGYDEDEARRMAVEAGALSADIMLETFGRLRGAHDYMKREFPECYCNSARFTAGGPSGLTDRNSSSWSDLVYIVSGCNPVILKEVKAMNCYEFMKLTEVGIKRKIF